MKKYKQTFIPSVSTVGFSSEPKFVKNYYAKHLQGKTVINKHLNIPIHFTGKSGRKIAFGGYKYIKKAAILQCLQQLLEVAEFNNFGNRKANDGLTVLGYLNFKAKIKIDNKIENVRIAVSLRKDGKVYYSHEVNYIRTKVASSRSR